LVSPGIVGEDVGMEVGSKVGTLVSPGLLGEVVGDDVGNKVGNADGA
jgi:hypothetical protein